MKAILIIILIVVVLGGVCVVTCPDQEAHTQDLKNLLNEVLTEELSKDAASDEDAGWVMFGSMIGTGVGGMVIDNILNVENYFVCSIGTVTYDGETYIVSLGVLNHVFTVDNAKVMQLADEIFN